MTRRSPHRLRRIDYRTPLKYWHVPKMAAWTYGANPVMMSLSEFREAARRGGWSSKSLYEYLKSSSEQDVPFVRLYKGPWPGPDGKERNRVIVVFFPVVTWGLWTKPVEEVVREQERWVERILNPAFRPYKIGSRRRP